MTHIIVENNISTLRAIVRQNPDNWEAQLLKPHVQRDLLQPLGSFSQETVEGMDAFGDYICGMSPVDGIRCLGFLRKASRDMRDAANSGRHCRCTCGARAVDERSKRQEARAKLKLKTAAFAARPFQKPWSTVQ
jgi:hypothetical protein